MLLFDTFGQMIEIPHGAFDLDDPVMDFRHFDFKQPADNIGMRPGKGDFWALGRGLNVQN